MTVFLTLSIILNLLLIVVVGFYYANVEFLVDELITQDDEIDELMQQVIVQQDAMAEFIQTGKFDPFGLPKSA